MNPQHHPRVSVVTIFWNAEQFLAEAIDSVIGQTYPEWELLLADDGSTDASTAIAQRYVARCPDRIRYLEHDNHQNRGMSATRNLAIRHARGDLVAFIDADDVWFRTKLEEQVAILDEHPAAGMVCGIAEYWRSWTGQPEDGLLDWEPDPGLPANMVYDPPELIVRRYPLGSAAAPCPSSLMVRREVVERVGGFEESFRGSYQLYEDQAFLAKLYLSTPVYVWDRCLTRYRQHPESCVSSVRRAGQYGSVRRYYLDWLQSYLQAHQIEDRQVNRAMRKARWEFEHPTLFALKAHARPLARQVYRIRQLVAPSTLTPEPTEPQPAPRIMPSNRTDDRAPQPSVSVVIPFQNAERFLEEAIQSVLKQTFQEWELLLVDDGSTDGSARIAGRYLDRYPDRMRYLDHEHHRRRGKSAACNLALRHARGQQVACLDADDVWLPEKLEQDVSALEREPRAALILSPSTCWTAWRDGEPDAASGESAPWALGRCGPGLVSGATALKAMLARPPTIPPIGSPLMRREAIDRAGGYVPWFRHLHADQALVARICLKEPVLISDRCQHRYRQHETSCHRLLRRMGRLEEEQRMFFNWLYGYLSDQAIHDPEIDRLLRRARRQRLPRQPMPSRPIAGAH